MSFLALGILRKTRCTSFRIPIIRSDAQFYCGKWVASIDFFAEEGIEERQEWIKELEAEQNPFDEATLDSLRNRRYWWLPRLQGEAIEGN
jgi:hypothetical protein